MSKIEEALIGWWGPRCTTFEEDCPCCQAWAEYDAIWSKMETMKMLIAAVFEDVGYTGDDLSDEVREAVASWVGRK